MLSKNGGEGIAECVPNMDKILVVVPGQCIHKEGIVVPRNETPHMQSMYNSLPPAHGSVISAHVSSTFSFSTFTVRENLDWRLSATSLLPLPNAVIIHSHRIRYPLGRQGSLYLRVPLHYHFGKWPFVHYVIKRERGTYFTTGSFVLSAMMWFSWLVQKIPIFLGGVCL